MSLREKWREDVKYLWNPVTLVEVIESDLRKAIDEVIEKRSEKYGRLELLPAQLLLKAVKEDFLSMLLGSSKSEEDSATQLQAGAFDPSGKVSYPILIRGRMISNSYKREVATEKQEGI